MSLPEFDNPPVSEVAISVAFRPLEKWNSVRAGVYWNSIKDEYPNVQVQGEIEPSIEKYGEESWQMSRIQLQLAGPEELIRVWYLTEPSNYLIQLQRDRFITNWRKRTGKEKYPRYESEIRPRFVREWKRFRDFVAKEGLGEIDVVQCEITYVNDIAKGDGWNSVLDVAKFFRPFCPMSETKLLPSIERFSISGSFLMPNQTGRLHYSSQFVLRGIDKMEVFKITIVSRGKPEGNDEAQILNWLDEGRRWIVLGFVDLTTPQAHSYWGKRG